MLRAVLPALALSFTGCAPDLEGIIQEIQDAPLLSTGPSSGPDTAVPTSTSSDGSGVWTSTDGGGEVTAAGTTEGGSPDTGDVASTGEAGALTANMQRDTEAPRV